MSNLMNTYILKNVPKDLKWYDHDDLLTWYDQRNSEKILRDTDSHFKQAKIINFDIIRRECRGEVPKDVLVDYQTVRDNDVLSYPKNEQRKLLSSTFRTDTQDIYFENKTIKKHFECEKKPRSKKCFFKKKLREKV